MKFPFSFFFIQRAKIQEKLERSRKEKEAAKIKYTEALQELNRANPKYMDDMNEVIDRFDYSLIFIQLSNRSSPGVKHSNEIVWLNFETFWVRLKNALISALDFSK
jgi:hypothetical protein